MKDYICPDCSTRSDIQLCKNPICINEKFKERIRGYKRLLGQEQLIKHIKENDKNPENS